MRKDILRIVHGPRSIVHSYGIIRRISMLLDKIKGQDEVILYLLRLIKKGAIPHLIFYGKKGIGKRETAIALGGAINCHSFGCEKCPSCKNLIHPDIKKIEDENGYIKIDTIREIIKEASFTPTYKRRVYIIDNAHFLTQEASNCILKTLEETQALFIFITNSLLTILPTIRSRCFVVRFKPIPFNAFKEEEEKELLSWISDIETSKETLLINRFFEMDKRMSSALDLLLFSLKNEGLYSMIDRVLKAKEELKAQGNRRLALEKMVLGLKNEKRDS